MFCLVYMYVIASVLSSIHQHAVFGDERPISDNVVWLSGTVLQVPPSSWHVWQIGSNTGKISGWESLTKLISPGQNGAISQATFSIAFSSMKIYEFRLRFHWNLFPRVNKPALVQVIVWCRTGDHYLNQCWPSALTHICGTRGRWVNS